MRILLVGTELAPVDEISGGLEHVLLGWARELAARHEVWVATLAGVRPPRPCRWEPFARVPVDAPGGLAHAARRLGADVVHLQNRPGWAAGLERVVVTLHNGPAAWADTRSTDGRSTDGRSEMASGLAAAGALTAVSRALADRVAAEVCATGGPAPPEVRVTYPFADPGFQAAAGGPPRQRAVLFPNRLLRKKGVEVALAVAAGQRPATAVPFVFLDVISPWTSPTPEHLALRRAVESTPHCSLLPACDRAQLAQLMAGAGVVLVPSLEEEGFGLVSVEAQAAGSRVAVSDRGGLPETVPDRSWVSAAGDAAALGALVARALDEPGPDPGAAAWVKSRFSRPASAAAVERVLLDVAG